MCDVLGKQKMYSFFSSFWKELLMGNAAECKFNSEKAFLDTVECSFEAVLRVKANFEKLIPTFEVLQDPKENVDTRRSVKILLSAEAIFLFWINFLSGVKLSMRLIRQTDLQRDRSGFEQCVWNTRHLNFFFEYQNTQSVEMTNKCTTTNVRKWMFT